MSGRVLEIIRLVVLHQITQMHIPALYFSIPIPECVHNFDVIGSEVCYMSASVSSA